MANPTKSPVITQLDAASVTLQNVRQHHGRLRRKAVVHTLPFASSAIGDVHRLLRFNSGDVISQIFLYSDGGATAGDADLGLYLASDGAVLDADLFASAWAVDTETGEAAGAQVNYRYEASGAAAGAFEVSMADTLWEILGRGIGNPVSDPLEQYDLCLTLTTALTVADTIIGCEVFYTAGD